MPYWQELAAQHVKHSKDKTLTYHTYDCSADQGRLCSALDIEHVPQWKFIGAADLHDRSIFQRLRKSERYKARIATFKGLNSQTMVMKKGVYVFAALATWVDMMHGISRAQSWWGALIGFFTGEHVALHKFCTQCTSPTSI